MKVLIACECSGRVREAFRTVGADVWSVDLKPSEDGSPYHHTGDVFAVLASRSWDLLIAHPPCTYLCASGMHWTTRGIRPRHLTEESAEFALRLWNAPVPRVCIENPVGILTSRIGPATQYIQPYQFGDDASKRTGLWLRGLPALVPDPARFVPGRLVGGLPRWANQTDSGQNRLGPGATRATERARTYPGIAAAMAEAWGRRPDTPGAGGCRGTPAGPRGVRLRERR